jgi:hypothetical protein
MATTISSNPNPESGHDQLAQSPVAYAASLWKAMVAVDDDITHKEKVEEEKALFRYKASSVQRLIVDRNLEFLENAYTNCRIGIKVNGLEAEGVTIQELDVLTWGVARSPINVWCHGCLQIIGAYMRYGEHSNIAF